MNFNSQEIKIGIIGLGYVGLPLAVEFSKKYSTIGFDVNTDRIHQLKNGDDLTLEVQKEDLIRAQIYYTTNPEKIKDCNIYIVTVPTPVDKNNKPDMQPLLSATEIISNVLEKGNTIIFESTVYPGATEDYCVPILEKKSNLVYNKEFFCGYSPERINPGDSEHTLTKIKKITSGSNLKTTKFIDSLYKSIISAGTFKTSSIAVAEAAKVIENIQRDVNIALINELAIIFNKLGLDTNEVLEAAGTKWNFMPFRPGLVGGHCIGVDPYYLTYKAQEIGYEAEMILAGRRINESMGKFIADNTISELVKAGITPEGARVVVFGITFKENCPDLRNTKVPDIIETLKMHNCKIEVFDPIADKIEAKEYLNINLLDFDQKSKCDVIILAVAHDEYRSINKEEFKNMFNSNGIIMDVKSIYEKDYFMNTSIKHWRL